jgi:superfamily II DNA or RNA helicase
MVGYFEDCLEDLCLKVRSYEEDVGLRRCQIGAYWAVKSHFTAYDEPALVSLPTGAGKTALMMLLAFGLNAKRVLVVSPSDVLRTQTFEKFSHLSGLVKAGVLEEEYEKPTVHRLTSRVTSPDVWDELLRADVVIALPNNISSEYNRDDLDDIVPPPDDFFDLVFFDEAHYSRAPSWQALLDEFENSKCVLLTATPFRRDRRSLPGKLVYFYPLRKAMDVGIYNPVRFEPVIPATDAVRDERLTAKAVEVLTGLREQYPVKMLIRTDRIDKATQLETLYNEKGIPVEAVHSRRTSLQNKNSIGRLNADELHGIVAVGQLGEGLDIPDLKVVVFHEPPKSFPFTIQLVGRITRRIEAEELDACVIADPNQLRQRGVATAVRKLYLEDDAWCDLIPEMVEEYAGDLIRGNTYNFSEAPLGADPEDLAPYLSTRLYRVGEDQISFDANLDLGVDCQVYRLAELENAKFLGVITRTDYVPPWARRTSLATANLDLHLYYYHPRSRTLFECSTSDTIASQIRERVIADPYERLGGEELVRVMHSEQDMNYLVAGLANALGPSGALPSYKMFLGREVQGAVDPTDSRVFTRGHVVARMTGGETRGISDAQGRVWSMKRVTIHEFIDWCEGLGNALVENQDVVSVQGLEFLGTPKRVQHFPDTPLLVAMNPATVSLYIELQDPEWDSPSGVDEPSFSIGELVGENNEVITLSFDYSSDAEPIALEYAIDRNQWYGQAVDEKTVLVEDGQNTDRYSIADFFDKYPPYFYLPDGSIVIAGQMQSPQSQIRSFPDESLVKQLDWRSCDVTVEYIVDTEKTKRFPAEGKSTVHQWLETKLVNNMSNDVIIYKDHTSGEAADYITIEPNKQSVRLYHCKAAPKVSSGDRKGEPDIGAKLDHVKNALDQVLRSVVWIKSRRLVDHIAERFERENQTHFVVGEESFEGLRSNFRPAEWRYQVYLVNPGLDQRLIAETENVNLVLTSCYEWLHSVDCELRIMGYDGIDEE